MAKSWKAILMAADEGTVNEKPMCLYDILGRPVIQYVMEAVQEAGASEICVLSTGDPKIYEECLKDHQGVLYLRSGRGEAAVNEAGFLDDKETDVLILSANTPLITAQELTGLIELHREHGNAVTYYMQEAGCVTPVLSREKGFCFCFRANYLSDALEALSRYAATDILSRVVSDGGRAEQCIVPECGAFSIVRSRVQLAEVLKKMQKRINECHMRNGVTILSPETTFISPDSEIGPETIIYPGTFLEGHTKIGQYCIIGPNTRIVSSSVGDRSEAAYSTILQSTVGKDTHVGPYAYVRPNSCIGDEVKVGDFVEVKNSRIGNGTKMSHLTYVGDADVGERINFGCGTVVVNYDGVHKYRTRIEDDAFIGCNVNLVSPVHVEKGAFVAAGSTITRDVPAEALAVARARQVNKEGWISPKKRISEEEK